VYFPRSWLDPLRRHRRHRLGDAPKPSSAERADESVAAPPPRRRAPLGARWPRLVVLLYVAKTEIWDRIRWRHRLCAADRRNGRRDRRDLHRRRPRRRAAGRVARPAMTPRELVAKTARIWEQRRARRWSL
jgi:hypothetical protein